MKKLAIAVIILIGVVAIVSGIVPKKEGNYESTADKVSPYMILTSPAFKQNEFIPKKYSCDGGDINPELHIQHVPDGAASLALIMDDPDAPNGTFVHWLVWNIDPKTTVIKEESVPPGLPAGAGAKEGSVEGTTSFGKIGYGGPCPPVGKPHRYFFKLYALDVILTLSGNTKKERLQTEVKSHLLAQAELVGLYQR